VGGQTSRATNTATLGADCTGAENEREKTEASEMMGVYRLRDRIEGGIDVDIAESVCYNPL